MTEQKLYGLSHIKYTNVLHHSLHEVLALDSFESALYHVVDYPFFDFFLKGFEVETLAKNDYILVCFGGAVDNRTSKTAPFFSGLSISSQLDMPLVTFADPIVSATQVNLAWYLGGEDKQQHVVQSIIDILRRIANTYHKNILLFGGAGGGFACLNIASQLHMPQRVKALVWNPQIKVENYLATVVANYIKAAFPLLSEGCPLENSSDFAAFFDDHGVHHDICATSLLDNVEVCYLQNKSDSHVDTHLNHFISRFALRSVNDEVLLGMNSMVYLGDWGSGHVVPPHNFITQCLRAMVSSHVVELKHVIKRMDYQAQLLLAEQHVNKHYCDLYPKLTLDKEKLSVDVVIYRHGSQFECDSLQYTCQLKNGTQVVDKQAYQNSPQFIFYANGQDLSQFILVCMVKDRAGNIVMNNFKLPKK